MRISDWSSDVCSSDLAPPQVARLEPGAFATSAPMTADVAAAEGARVRALIRARRMRDQFFRSELFADPAWDMLLDLMAARLEHKRVSVSSLCIAAAVPVTRSEEHTSELQSLMRISYA